MTKKICVGIFLFFVFFLNVILDIHIKEYLEILERCFDIDIPLSTNGYTFICFVIALISILISIDTLLVFLKPKDENKGIKFKTEDGTFGTSSWMCENEMKNVLGLDDVPGIILGKYENKIVKLPFDSYFNKNICVFGSSRKYENNRFLIN